MKKLILLAIVFLGLGINAQAQQAVSAALTSQFTKLYTDATDVDWEEDDDGNFVAFFNLGDDYGQATFTKDAKWLKSSLFQSEEALPAVIKEKIGKAYDDFFYNQVEKVTTPDSLVYHVEIETDDAIIRMQFDNDGKLLKKEKETFDE